MGEISRRVFWVFLVVIFVITEATAAGPGFHGRVTDETGKPVRGAIVKATAGYKSVIRYTQPDGQYEIALPPGNYSVVVDAFGFGAKRLTKDAGEAGDTNFSLTHKLDLTRLSGADLENLLPDNADTRHLNVTCIECHGIENIMHKSGFTASEWKDFIPVMTRGKVLPPNPKPSEMAAITAALEKYFGPDAPYFGPDADPPKPEQLRHAEIPDEALNATIREYTIPTGLPSMPHSIMVDPQDNAWFSERGIGVHKIGHFESATEKFDEFTIPENGTPHTGVIGKNGSVWMSLIHDGNPLGQPDLAQVDPETGKVTVYKIPDAIKKLGVHTLAAAPDGSVWMGGSSVWRFDPKTEQFKEYKVPLPSGYSASSIEQWRHVDGEPPTPVVDTRTTFYDIKVDSKGRVWTSEYTFGFLCRIDPVSGQTKEFHPPDANMIKGVEIDAQDNVWFAGFHSNTLGKLDPNTGEFKTYHFPTRYAMPYGIAFDKRTGNIWIGDMNGQHVTRFDPKTEHFTEFPVPLSRPKFLGIDSKSRVWFTEYLDGKIGMLDTGGGGKQLSSMP